MPHDVVYLFHLSYFQKLAMCQNQTTCVQCLRCRSCLVCHFLLPWVDHQVDVPSSHHECVDIWGNGCVWRCWDGAMMCHVISPVKTGKDCFPVNLWCEVFNVLTVSTGQLTGFSVLLVWPGHRAYEVHGESRPHDFSIYRNYPHDLRCLSFSFVFACGLCGFPWWYPVHLVCLILFAGLDVLFRYHNPQLQLFESPVYFQRAKDNMKMIFSTILDWKLQADGYPGEVASLSKWLGHNFSNAACWRRWWDLYICPLLE